MENGVTINHQGFDHAAAENWYLSCMPIKPIPKVKIRFEDGREYIYKGKNTLKIGDVAVIGRGCNTSFEMGEVTAVGVAGGGKSYMSNAQYVFSTSPSQDIPSKLYHLTEPITSYYAYLETMVYKLGYYFGFLLADELLYWVVPGYRHDSKTTYAYSMEISKYLNVDIV